MESHYNFALFSYSLLVSLTQGNGIVTTKFGDGETEVREFEANGRSLAESNIGDAFQIVDLGIKPWQRADANVFIML